MIEPAAKTITTTLYLLAEGSSKDKPYLTAGEKVEVISRHKWDDGEVVTILTQDGRTMTIAADLVK